MGEDETILSVFQDKNYNSIDINYIDKDFHNLENIPHSFFQIDDESISYIFAHVFTYKRYIGIGLIILKLSIKHVYKL